MGWFDQETKEAPGAPAPTAKASRTPSPAPAPAPAGSSSTIGQRVRVSGKVMSDENLEIVGTVDGTIHARAGLKIAREAEVQAVIHGVDVVVEGTVKGDVNASKTLILGSTAALTGNIKTPSLQIREGAFFRGQVSMQQAEKPADDVSARPAVADKAGQSPKSSPAASRPAAEAADKSATSEKAAAATAAAPAPADEKPPGAAKPAGAAGA